MSRPGHCASSYIADYRVVDSINTRNNLYLIIYRKNKTPAGYIAAEKKDYET